MHNQRAMRLLRLFTLLSFTISIGSCAPNREYGPSASSSSSIFSSSLGSGVKVDGYLKSVSDADLSEAVEVLVDAEVLSVRVIALRDDPALPSDWEADPELARFVRSGATFRKWELRILANLKSTTPTEIWAVSGGALEPDHDGLRGSDAPSAGEHARFWLRRFPLFGPTHFILVRARVR